MWKEYDFSLTQEDLDHAHFKGNDHPVLMRLSASSPEAQAIFEDIHGLPMCRRRWLRSDAEAVTEIMDIPEATRLLRAHLGNRAEPIIEAMTTIPTPQNSRKAWSVIDIFADGTTHEMHISRQAKDHGDQPSTADQSANTPWSTTRF
jgi:hypothetical protein